MYTVLNATELNIKCQHRATVAKFRWKNIWKERIEIAIQLYWQHVLLMQAQIKM